MESNRTFPIQYRYRIDMLPRGRSETRCAQLKRVRPEKCFAFGSSTPRELSHIKGVPRSARLIDSRETLSPEPPDILNGEERRSIIYYMRQARCRAPSNIHVVNISFIDLLQIDPLHLRVR